jgi:hypothetical protein
MNGIEYHKTYTITIIKHYQLIGNQQFIYWFEVILLQNIHQSKYRKNSIPSTTDLPTQFHNFIFVIIVNF